jgi:ketosteroid isomerase-like protein
MRRYRSLLVPVLLILSAGMPQAQTKLNDVAQRIRDLRDRWIDAEEHKDIPFLKSLIADDCVIGNSQGQVLNKAQFLARMQSPDRDLKITNTRNVRVRVYGNVAVMTEEITIDGTDHGKPFGGDFRFVRVFAKQAGQWQVVLGQGTPVPKSDAAAQSGGPVRP